MLIVAIASWKPENERKVFKALAERKIPLPKEAKLIEYYILLGQHKGIAILEVPDEKAIAMSALNWADIAEVKYIPAVTAREYMKLRADLL